MVTWVALAALFLFFGSRVLEKTGVFHMGKLVEAGPTGEIFTNSRDTRTRDDITGRFG